MEEKLLVYALKAGVLTHITQVESGEKCDCYCPVCNGKLIARKGNIKRHHFAHKGDTNCQYACETSLHMLAKEILSRAVTFWVPEVILNLSRREDILIGGSTEISIASVELEKKYHPIIPDVVVTTTEGEKLIVEILVTHEVDSEKQKILNDIDISALEIDLSMYKDNNFLEDEVRDVLLGTNEKKYWVHNKEESSYKFKLRNKSDLISIESGKVECPLENHSGSKVYSQACCNCPYRWELSNDILCGGRLRVSQSEHIIATQQEDGRRVAECKMKEHQKRIAQKEISEKRAFNLDRGICPDCGGKLKIKRRNWDKKKFIGCGAWEYNGTGCNFTLDFNSEEAQGTTFVKEHLIHEKQEKISVRGGKCPWCRNPLVEKNPKDGGNPFLSCSTFPKCKFTRNYSKDDLAHINEEKKLEKENQRKVSIKEIKPYIESCFNENICPICKNTLTSQNDRDIRKIFACSQCSKPYIVPYIEGTDKLNISDKFCSQFVE